MNFWGRRSAEKALPLSPCLRFRRTLESATNCGHAEDLVAMSWPTSGRQHTSHKNPRLGLQGFQSSRDRQIFPFLSASIIYEPLKSLPREEALPVSPGCSVAGPCPVEPARQVIADHRTSSVSCVSPARAKVAHAVPTTCSTESRQSSVPQEKAAPRSSPPVLEELSETPCQFSPSAAVAFNLCGDRSSTCTAPTSLDSVARKSSPVRVTPLTRAPIPLVHGDPAANEEQAPVSVRPLDGTPIGLPRTQDMEDSAPAACFPCGGGVRANACLPFGHVAALGHMSALGPAPPHSEDPVSPCRAPGAPAEVAVGPTELVPRRPMCTHLGQCFVGLPGCVTPACQVRLAHSKSIKPTAPTSSEPFDRTAFPDPFALMGTVRASAEILFGDLSLNPQLASPICARLSAIAVS
uniref:Uncharacterized protein n=1 Tax=Noctiluca scintillans TaxID=2966 RepID=A0A7S1AEV4_NOCSC|mmetsp:Transcript_43524/g.114876  ORF Transcript_43524/g.114876 Transcript_43524/m.114876 type:complete len:408 (+) Transcript_43524:103-1326(+)